MLLQISIVNKVSNRLTRRTTPATQYTVARVRLDGLHIDQQHTTNVYTPQLSQSFCNRAMGRMHSNGKGIARSALPYSRSKPSWVKEDAETVKAEIAQLAKKGKTPSQIGVILRDSKGYPQIKAITGQKILRILKKSGLAPEIPEDLYHLIKRAVNVRRHLDRNRKDKDSKFRLILVESRIHRLARYYKTKKQLPPSWK